MLISRPSSSGAITRTLLLSGILILSAASIQAQRLGGEPTAPRSPIIADDLSPYALNAASKAPGDTLAFSYFQSEDTLFTWTYNPADSGYIFGSNYLGDQAFAVGFELPESVPSATFLQANFFLSALPETVGDKTYKVEVFNGDFDTGPVGEPLFSSVQRFADAGEITDTSVSATTVTVSEGFTVESPFFVSVDFGEYDTVQDRFLAAIGATGFRPSRQQHVFLKDQNGEWSNISDLIFNGTEGPDLFILAVAIEGQPIVSNEWDGPGGASVLYQNYPNPVDQLTSIAYELQSAGPVRLELFDILGRQVRVMVDEPQTSGTHLADLDLSSAPSGQYVYRLTTAGNQQTRLLTVTR